MPDTNLAKADTSTEELRAINEQLVFALSAAGVGTWDLDPVKNTVRWDQRCRELFGFAGNAQIPFAEVMGCIHADDIAAVNAAVLVALDPKTEGLYHIRYRTVSEAEGITRWVLCKGKAYFDTAGVAYRFAGTVQDITAEVRARHKEQHLLSLVAHNADHMSIAGMDGRMIYMNQSAKVLLGVDGFDDITQFTAVNFYSEQELKRVQEQVLKQITSESGYIGNINLTNYTTKEVIPCQVSYILVRDPKSGEVIGRGATVRDLRPEQKARQEMADKNQELQSVVAELRFLANSVPSVVWTSTPDGLLDYINDRWFEHGSRSLEDTLGAGWAETLHPDDKQAAWDAWSVSLATGDPYQIEFRLLDKTGTYRWWLVRALPLKDESGTVIKWYGTNTDITDQKELERQKDNFLGIASHELKTPITSIKAYVQVMGMLFKRAGDIKNAEVVAKMDRQVNRLNALVGDLLDVTKINTGRLQFSNEVFDFNRMVEEVTEDVQRTTAKHLIRRELQFKRTMTGDRDRICQVISNLLTNAIKYSPDANEIVIYTEDHETEVQLCVQDFGIGISADKKDKVFEQFYRVSGTREYTFPGLGLGLYISSEIVKRSGGRIWVGSTEGKGSTFCFALPLKQNQQ